MGFNNRNPKIFEIMNLIEKIRLNASKLGKSIVLPESGDMRTLKAAAYLANNSICKPILIGNEDIIRASAKNLGVDLSDMVGFEDPKTSKLKDLYAASFYEKRKAKGITPELAAEQIGNELFFAASMVSHRHADGCVAGAVNTTGDVLKAAFQVIGMKQDSQVVSSVFLMSFPDGRVFSYGDCAVVPYPDADQLASIAVDSSITHRQLTGEDPFVAMLSFSTKGSAKHERVQLVSDAYNKVKTLQPLLKIDGEIQFDAALVEAIGKKKAPGSEVAGRANVFIFPNLDAGNIAYKITERLAGATATGPIIQGLSAPMNDLSRGCSWEDIVNTASVSVLQSV